MALVGCALVARLAPARKFHTLLAGGATECSEHYYAIEGRRDFRAYDKTARRFCFSPHELEMGGGVMKHQRSKGVQSHSECEKCGLGGQAWRGERATYAEPRSRNAFTVFFINIATVIGPTPPGTGVILEQRGATAGKLTSPTSR